MRGYPKVLKTRYDYDYVRANFDKEYWLKDFQALLDSAYVWVFTGMLKNKEDGIEDETHKIEVMSDTEDGKEEYMQFELKYDQNCMLEKIGYTMSEVAIIINNA